MFPPGRCGVFLGPPGGKRPDLSLNLGSVKLLGDEAPWCCSIVIKMVRVDTNVNIRVLEKRSSTRGVLLEC